MPVLALAGGTSATLGRAITTAVLSGRYTNTPWKMVLLSRTTNRPDWLKVIDPQGSQIEVRAVDYMQPNSMSLALTAQDSKNLLHAAITAGCRRFAPSQWGMGPLAYESGTFGVLSDGVWNDCLNASDRIETARFNNGLLLNYFGYGILSQETISKAMKPRLAELQGGCGYASGGDQALEGVAFEGIMSRGEGAFFVSLKDAIAELPVKNDGQWARIGLTRMRDIGKFVAASLELPRWLPNMNIMGDIVNGGELLALCENITQTKFDLKQLDQGTLQQELASLPEDADLLTRLPLEFKEIYCRDEEGFGWSNPTVNELCPRVTPMTVDQYLRKWWPFAGTSL